LAIIVFPQPGGPYNKTPTHRQGNKKALDFDDDDDDDDD